MDDLEIQSRKTARRREVPYWLWAAGDFLAEFWKVVLGALLICTLTCFFVFWFIPEVEKSRAEFERVVSTAKETWKTESTVELAAMANGSRTSGSGSGAFGIFVLRLGQEDVIRYTERTPEGGFQLKQVPAGGITVFEIDPENADPKRRDGAPRIEKQRCELHAANPWDQHVLSGSGQYSCGERTAIYVPKGSVQTDFTLDPVRG